MPLTDAVLQQHATGGVFFETGTYRGDGIAAALRAGFGKIVSIEIDPQWAAAARVRFAKEVAGGQVDIVEGDTKVVMAGVLGAINEPITFWLDAHWDYGPTKGEVICPLYEELEAIRMHPIKTHTIMIDDMRLMENASHHWGATMQKNRIIAALSAINGAYRISYADGDLGPEYGGIAKNDIMIARI